MSSLVYLLLFFSLHACNAHHLGVIDVETGEGFHLLSKDLVQGMEKGKHPKPQNIPSSVSPSFSEGMRKEETHESWDGANKMKCKEIKAPCKEKGDTRGNEMTASSSSSSKEVLQLEARKIVKWKGQARRMLRSASHVTKEQVDSKENDAVEDIIVMDYAQPHRNAPIHNREP